jgi:hypothetical protein
MTKTMAYPMDLQELRRRLYGVGPTGMTPTAVPVVPVPVVAMRRDVVRIKYLGAILGALIATDAHAYECSDVLSGTYDYVSVVESTRSITDFRKQVCDSSGRSIGLEASFKVVGLGFDYGEVKSRCGTTTSSTDFDSKSDNLYKLVNQWVIAAWSKCVEQTPISAAVTYGVGGDPKNFQIIIRNNRSITLKNVIELDDGIGGLHFRSGAQVSCAPDWIQNEQGHQYRQIQIEKTLSCARSDEKVPVTILVQTYKGYNPIQPSVLIVPAFKEK